MSLGLGFRVFHQARFWPHFHQFAISVDTEKVPLVSSPLPWATVFFTNWILFAGRGPSRRHHTVGLSLMNNESLNSNRYCGFVDHGVTVNNSSLSAYHTHFFKFSKLLLELIELLLHNRMIGRMKKFQGFEFTYTWFRAIKWIDFLQW